MNQKLQFLAIAIPLLASRSAAAELPTPDVDGFKQTVAPLLAKYCTDCHGPDAEEGGLALHNIDANLITGGQFETWRIVDEQLRFGDMPPKDADQRGSFM